MLAATSPRTARSVLLASDLPRAVRVGLVAEPVRRLATGIAALDAVLDGGWPRGRLSELTGPASAGKTTVLLALLAAATRRGETVALIDLPDALHPRAAATAGVELGRVVWVRPPSFRDGLRCAELLLEAGGFGVVAIDVGTPAPRPLRAPVWPRLAHAAERAKAVVAITAPYRLAGSFAAVSLGIAPRQVRWSRGAWPLLDGFELQLTVMRNKLGAPGKTATVSARSADSGP